jgi:twitching motility protein PilJ
LLAENAGAALGEIEQVSNQIATLVQNISTSAREQGKAASAVTRSMDVLKEINGETAASTSATASSISKLSELATQLRRSVAGFRLPANVVRGGGATGVANGEPPAARDGGPARSSGDEPAAATGRYPQAVGQAVGYASQRTA